MSSVLGRKSGKVNTEAEHLLLFSEVSQSVASGQAAPLTCVGSSAYGPPFLFRFFSSDVGDTAIVEDIDKLIDAVRKFDIQWEKLLKPLAAEVATHCLTAGP